MSPAIEKLLAISGSALSNDAPNESSKELSREKELARLLQVKNGMFCFEASLHVFHSGTDVGRLASLETWNSIKGWRKYYGNICSNLDVFFAQDVFGGQFSLRTGEVWYFDPETGDMSFVAPNLDEWCSIILLDWRVLTGYPLAHEWQRQHGVLQRHQRLIPKAPFFLGGAFSVENLYAADAAASMKSRAEVARQIAHLPDGANIRLKPTDNG